MSGFKEIQEVRKERFELSRVTPLASETSAYASSATSASVR